MTTPRFESYLARLYTDRAAREKFLEDPRGESERAGLSPQEVDALCAIDRVGLELMAESLHRKRMSRATSSPR